MALLGMFNVHRHGAINSAAIVLYALTSCVSGYVSCCFYTQINGQRWVWNIILTSSLFSGEHLDMKEPPVGKRESGHVFTYGSFNILIFR